MNVEVYDGREPAYKQLCEQIIQSIVQGDLKPGDRLPSEAALYHSTGLSKGTIRMAYAELEHRGCIKRSRGSGTYIQEWGTERQKVRAYKEKALKAGIQGEEAFRLIEEACRQKFRKKKEVRAAVFECTPEIAAGLCCNIRESFNILPHCYDVYDILEAFGSAVPEEDLWITTKAHRHELQNLAEKNHKTLIALQTAVDDEVVKTLSGLSDTCTVGIIYESREFIKHISRLLASLCRHNTLFLCRRDEWESRKNVVEAEPICWIAPAHYEEKPAEAAGEEKMNVVGFYYRILPESYKDIEQYLQEV